MLGTYTIILIIITVLVSLSALRDQALMNKLILWPRRMDEPKEYYRLLTSGFIHADMTHLFFNMFTLFFIGSFVEAYFTTYSSRTLYVVLYLAGIIVASLPSFFKHRQNSYYRSLGASGGVAAVLFSSVYFAPWSTIRIWFIPMPNIVFGILYLVYSMYMSRRGGDFINHDAHFWGAVFGLVFTWAIDPFHGQAFLEQLMHPPFLS
ncbi:rhomboid family intramembrane serine protease [Chitinophagaceae bacterium MMS25-I14]